jgi:hypothetical protein
LPNLLRRRFQHLALQLRYGEGGETLEAGVDIFKLLAGILALHEIGDILPLGLDYGHTTPYIFNYSHKTVFVKLEQRCIVLPR